MGYNDYKTVYHTLDHDQAGYIDFQKFCLINIDRSNDINRLISMTQKNDSHMRILAEDREN